MSHFADYDLCQHCYDMLRMFHPRNHLFTRYPSETSASVPRQQVVHKGVICDRCNDTIKDIRYKVILSFDDFYLIRLIIYSSVVIAAITTCAKDAKLTILVSITPGISF